MRTAAFIVAQIPFADFRPLYSDRLGFLDRPQWEHDSPTGFIRGFGKVAARNSSSAGLHGEHSFADMDKALRFPERIEYQRPNGEGLFRPVPWFRRLYFDGRLSGRFEVGFRVYENHNDVFPFETPEVRVDPQKLARIILECPVEVHSTNGWKSSGSFGTCWKDIKAAYIEATTRHGEFSHSFDELLDAVRVGPVFLHARVGVERLASENAELNKLPSATESTLYTSSSGGNFPRNNLLIQTTSEEIPEESGDERLVRVLFAHLNSVIFAYSQLLRGVGDLSENVKQENMQSVVAAMLKRLSGLNANQDEVDQKFTKGLHIFSEAYGQRVPDLLEKLHALASDWNKPKFPDRLQSYLKRVHDLVITSAVEKTVEIAARGGA